MSIHWENGVEGPDADRLAGHSMGNLPGIGGLFDDSMTLAVKIRRPI